MRNLKKYLAVLLVVIMTLTAMAPAFAAGFTYETQGAALKDLGIIEGVSATDLGLGLDLNREQGIKVVLGLVGKLDAAEALSAADAKAALAGFKDAADVTEWAVPYVAYAVKNKIVDGMDATTLAPKIKLSGKMFATMILRNLNYKVEGNDYNIAATILADKGGLTAEQAKLFNDKNLIRDDMVGIAYGALSAKDSAGKTVIANLVAAGVVDAAKAEAYKLISGDATVASVAAASAKAFKVTFTNAVADTSKVAFTVKRETSTVSVTTSWNEAKTEATLTYSSNLPEASYTVAVKNDTKDLGTSTVAITSQKVAAIEITSKSLAIVTAQDGSQTGYATFKVLDQYKNDVTNSYFGTSVTFQSGIGDATWTKEGIIKITPFASAASKTLVQYPTAVITGYESSTGVSVTATLPTATSMGTLTNFQLGTLESNVVLTAGDVTTVYYVPFTATDMSGNDTKVYELVAQGVIDLDQSTSEVELSASSPNVSAKIVHDPADYQKAAVELRVKGTAADVLVDMPVTVTAMTYTGKNTSVSLTLKKANEVSTFTLMAPTANIAVGDKNKEIPFEAFDQAGNKVTRFADLANGQVTLSPSDVVKFDQKPNGDARVIMTPPASYTVKYQQTITASVAKTGKFSQLTISIQDAAKANSLELDSSVLVSAMQYGATQGIDFGWDNGGLKVLDQYGREIDMTTWKAAPAYTVLVSSDDTSDVTVTGNVYLTNGATTATINAVAAAGGSAALKFELWNISEGKLVATRSQLISVIKNSDIKDYTIDAINPIYASTNAKVALKARDMDYYAKAKVYGKSVGGAKVLLADNAIIGAYVDNSNEFQANINDATYEGVRVVANDPTDPTKTEASTNLTVSVKDAYTGLVRALTTTVKSTQEAPKATELVADIAKWTIGLSVSSDVVTIDTTAVGYNAATINFVDDAYMGNFEADGDAASKSLIKFYAKDQYGKKGMQIAQFSRIAFAGTGANVDITADGQLVIAPAGFYNDGATAEDSVTITAVTSNGLVKTIKIVIK